MNRHINVIMMERNKAVEKYPQFVKRFIADTITLPMVDNALAIARHRSDTEGKDDDYSFSSTLKEEVLEVFEAYFKGEYEHTYQELAQCGAVIIRAMEWLTTQHKEVFNDNNDKT